MDAQSQTRRDRDTALRSVSPEGSSEQVSSAKTCPRSAGGIDMLRWALLFLIVGLIAGGLGFWRLEGTAMYIAKVLAVVFVILFLVSLVSGRRRPKV